MQFVDAQGHLLGYLAPQRYGVSGGWDFTGPHDRQRLISLVGIDPAVAAQVTQIVFAFGYDPYSEFLAQVEAELVKTINQAVGTVLNLIQSGFAGVIELGCRPGLNQDKPAVLLASNHHARKPRQIERTSDQVKEGAARAGIRTGPRGRSSGSSLLIIRSHPIFGTHTLAINRAVASISQFGRYLSERNVMGISPRTRRAGDGNLPCRPQGDDRQRRMQLQPKLVSMKQCSGGARNCNSELVGRHSARHSFPDYMEAASFSSSRTCSA